MITMDTARDSNQPIERLHMLGYGLLNVSALDYGGKLNVTFQNGIGVSLIQNIFELYKSEIINKRQGNSIIPLDEFTIYIQYFKNVEKSISVIIYMEEKEPSIKIYKGTPVNFCMPSIDVLFFSAAKVYRNRAMGIILTGMGADGVEGLGAIKRVGGKTIAEAEETAILYAMPKFAAEKGFANLFLPNYNIKDEIIKFVRK